MPRSCSVCTHEQTAAISKSLAAGDSIRGVSTRFGLTHASVQRHLVGCLRIVRRAERVHEKTAVREERVSAPDSSRHESETDPKALIRRAELLLDDAMTILARAKAADDSRLGLQAVRECRGALELLMRSVGLLQPDGAVTLNIDARRQQIAFFDKLPEVTLRALVKGDCPHCGNALVAVTDAPAALTA
jgi:hypothetical protein